MADLLFRKLTGIPGQDIYRLEHHQGLKKSYRMLVQVMGKHQINGPDWHIIPAKAVYQMFEDYTPAALSLNGGDQ